MNHVDITKADPNEQHERYMRHCIELAEIALGQGNTPVGSIVVVDDEVLGEGSEEVPAGNHITGHAEIVACQAALDKTRQRKLDGAILYSTAEPCFMCSYVIRQCGISLVVYGSKTPIIGGATSDLSVLTNECLNEWMPPPQVIGGILESNCERLRSSK